MMSATGLAVGIGSMVAALFGIRNAGVAIIFLPLLVIVVAALLAGAVHGFSAVARFLGEIFGLTVADAAPGGTPAARPAAPASRLAEENLLRLRVQDLFLSGKITRAQMEDILRQRPADGPPVVAPGGSASTAPAMAPPPVIPPPSPVPPASAVPPLQTAFAAPPAQDPYLHAPAPAASSAASGETPSSGFFNSSSVKTLLLSGATLLFFSVYLFVRSHWATVPDAVKFAGLTFLTALLYGAGFALVKKGMTEKTSHTLVGLGLMMVPFNVYAANVWLYGNHLSAETVWTVGCVLMCVMAFLTHHIVPIGAVRQLMSASFLGALYFGAGSAGWSDPIRRLVMASGNLIMAFGSASWFEKDERAKDFMQFAALAAVAVSIPLALRGFFWWEGEALLYSSMTLVVLGATWAVLSRFLDSRYAYIAGPYFLSAAILVLRYFHVPLYKYGYLFVPAGLVALLRAWTFERSDRGNLAKPYFMTAQIALLGSVLAVLPTFWFKDPVGLFPLLLILGAAASAYAVGGALYKSSFFVYAGGMVLLLALWTFVWGDGVDFSQGTLFFAGAGCFLLMMGALGGRSEEEFIEGPLMLMGFGTLSLTMALLAGKWGNRFFATGELVPVLPVEQLRAGLWTGALSVAAYGFMAAIKKKPAFLYPALLSATWLYICVLEMNGISVRLIHVSWIVAASLSVHYLLEARGKTEAAKCFALWGEMAFLIVAILAVFFDAPWGAWAALVCTAAFLPGLFFGRADLMFGFLGSAYAAHFLAFRAVMGDPSGMNWAEYALWLIPMNAGVIFIRTLLTRWRPQVSMVPFRGTALAFALISLWASLMNFNVAWQVYLAHGLLALLVSQLHYDGRFRHVGGLLILAACEFFLLSRHVEYLEAYTLPVSVYLILLGTMAKAQKETRDFLYGFAMVILYAPSSIKAMSETWEWHGIFLGVASLVLMLYGIHQRSKVLMFPSLLVLMINGFIQSRQFFLTVPRWIYLGLAGATLLTLGGLFEFKRDALVGLRDGVKDTFDDWD